MNLGSIRNILSEYKKYTRQIKMHTQTTMTKETITT